MNHDKINLLRKKIQNMTEMLELAIKKNPNTFETNVKI